MTRCLWEARLVLGHYPCERETAEAYVAEKLQAQDLGKTCEATIEIDYLFKGIKGDIDNVYSAKLAEQAERYDEMAEHMRYVGTWKEASSMCLC